MPSLRGLIMAISANNVINDALSLIDAISLGEDAEAYWAQLGVRMLNGLLGEWQTKGIYNPQIVFGETTISSSTRYITIGTDGTTNGDIPIIFGSIKDVTVDLGNVTYTLQRKSLEEYLELSIKDTKAVPMYYAYDYSYPIGKIYMFPSPLMGLKVRVFGAKALTTIANNQSDLEFSEIYYTALVYNLACKLYPFLKRDNGIDQSIIFMAKSSLEGLRTKSNASKLRGMKSPYTSNNKGSSYWTSSLNSVTQ